MTYCLGCKKEWTHTQLSIVLETGLCPSCGADREELLIKYGYKSRTTKQKESKT